MASKVQALASKVQVLALRVEALTLSLRFLPSLVNTLMDLQRFQLLSRWLRFVGDFVVVRTNDRITRLTPPTPLPLQTSILASQRVPKGGQVHGTRLDVPVLQMFCHGQDPDFLAAKPT